MPIPRSVNAVILALCIAATLSACALFEGEQDPTKGWSASKLYAEAKDALDGGDYERAIDLFETLEARYPFGRYAQQAQLDIAYAYYKFDEPDSAIAAADRFIKLHPKSPHVDYAYYLKGLANFNRGKSIFSYVIPRDLENRDPVPLKRAFEDFKVIVTRYPDSPYTEDARKRMVFLRNKLAAHELAVADFYMRRGAYVAAANRAQYILEHYQRATAIPQALEILIKAYRRLHLNDLALQAYEVMRLNYPERARKLARKLKIES